MARFKSTGLVAGTLAAATAALTLLLVPERPLAQIPPTTQFVMESALLDGLAPGAVFPFVDTTPRRIERAHVAITDDTSSCMAGGAPPRDIQVLVGEAGVALVNVMTAATNTGISTVPGQCVFHVTVVPGTGGVPRHVTDIAVLNTGASGIPLSGVHTMTVSAEVR